jgi:hypothetical protein
MRVLAVANMHVDQATRVTAYGHHDGGDQDLKEGYGLLKLDSANRRYTFEAWRAATSTGLAQVHPPGRVGPTSCPSTTPERAR